jgi:hypothetical protein
MAPLEQTQPGPSTLDALIRLAKKISLLTGLVTGLSLVALYFFGIAIYATFSSAFGVPPFEFSLQHCLEYGGAYAGVVLTLLPLLAVYGLVDYFREAGPAQHVFLGLPLALLWLVETLRRRSGGRFRILRQVSVLCLLSYTALYLVVVYLTMVSTLAPRSLLLDPAVNVALSHREELKAGANPVKFGIRHWDGFTLNMVIRDEQWKIAKIGETFLMGLLAVVYGFLTVRCADRNIGGMRAAGEKVWIATVAGRWIFYVLFAAVLVSFLFVAPGRTAVMIHTMPKVDVSIRGLSPLTSRYFLIQVAEYERSYAFYVPTEQTILKVPREQVEYVMFKQDVSPFADRSLFRKGSWLGVRGQWKPAPGNRVTEGGSAIGFEVAAVDAGSPASAAGIVPGDLLVELDGVRLDGSLEPAAVAALGLQGQPATLLVSRGGKPLKLRLQLEQAR